MKLKRRKKILKQNIQAFEKRMKTQIDMAKIKIKQSEISKTELEERLKNIEKEIEESSQRLNQFKKTAKPSVLQPISTEKRETKPDVNRL